MRRLLLATLIAAPLTVMAEGENVTSVQGMTIFGQSELPKVLYIVPWKRKELPEIEAPQTVTLVSDALTPIKPEIFERQVHYYELMTERLRNEQ